MFFDASKHEFDGLILGELKIDHATSILNRNKLKT